MNCFVSVLLYALSQNEQKRFGFIWNIFEKKTEKKNAFASSFIQYPPKIILDIVKPIHDKCVEETGVSEGKQKKKQKHFNEYIFGVQTPELEYTDFRYHCRCNQTVQ